MKSVILLLAAISALLAAEPTQSFSGRITDTMCGPRHGMVKGQSDDECARSCVKMTSSQFALFDGKSLLRLNDQKTPAKFAGQEVKVTGTLNEKTHTIKVTAIEPAQ